MKRGPMRNLLVMLVAGAFLSVFALLLFQLALTLAGVPPDSSVLDFYPIMAGAGLIFGFERWWSYEQGPVNPFHDA